MQVFGYYDLTTKNLSNSLDGEAAVTLPPIIAGETLRFNVRFRESRDGVPREVVPNVRAMKAVLGFVDKRPSLGGFKLDVDGQTTADAITYVKDSTGVDPDFATKLQTAIESLAAFSSGDVVVETRNNSFIVTFPNDPETEHDFTILENRLHPVCFVRVRTYERGDRWEHEIRLVTAPVAFTNTFERENGPVPEITTLRDGGSADEVEWSEIQKLHVPPGFAGTFRLVKNSFRSNPLSRRSTTTDILSAITPLADAGGIFNVTNPIENVAYIEFAGDMTGENYDPLEIEIFDGPPADWVVALDTKTREMADVMQENDSIQLVLEIHAEIEDVDDEDVFLWHTLYRRDVTIQESVNWDELAVSPQINWLNPPTFTSHSVFSPNQVANGQIHYTTTIGNGVASEFEITHGLDTDNINVIVTDNTNPGAHRIPGVDYTWTRDNSDQVTISWLGDVPDNAALLVTVLGLELTSFFDPHTHTIAEVEGLQDWMTAMEARVSQLEATSGGNVATETGYEGGESARWTLPTLWELYPSRAQPARTESGALNLINLDEESESGRKIFARGRGLLPAVHDATVEDLPIPVPRGASEYVNRVFENVSDNDVILAGGAGNRSKIVKPGGFAACDARGIWYPVVKHGEYYEEIVTMDHTTDPLLWTFSDEEGEFLAEDSIVELITTNTLPTNFATGTSYRVTNANFATRQFSLRPIDSDTVISAGSSGTGTHRVVITSKISYYPEHFERELFKIHVNSKQLRARKNFDLMFTFEAALLKANVDAQWALAIEIGEARGVYTVGDEDTNLDEIVWRKIPALEQMIILTPVATTHNFGLRIARRLIDGVDTLTLHRVLYGAMESGGVPPLTANFALRAVLKKFDTSDNETDAKGLIMLSGLNVSQSTNAVTVQDESGFENGFAIIH